jgi:uncharacterized integral membrane protein
MADTNIKPPQTTPQSEEQSKIKTIWSSIAFAVVLLALFVTFVGQNAQDVTVHFLWMNGTISLALALIIATLVGAIITFIVGSIRIWQLSHKKSQAKNQEKPKNDL